VFHLASTQANLLFYSVQGRIHGAIRQSSPKPTKVTLFTMILYNSENNTSKPTPNKSFVMFQLSHCSRYKAILSSIILLQQCYEVYCQTYYRPPPSPLMLVSGLALDSELQRLATDIAELMLLTASQS